jgi:hypothetical protein
MNLRALFFFPAFRSLFPSLTALHTDVPQTEEAKTEAFQLMNIKRNLVTPRNGEPIIAATQDFITGCYLITRRDTFFNRQEFTQMCTYLQDAELEITIPPPTILKPERLWTGKQIFNVLMRPNSKSNVNVNLECKNKTMLAPSKDHGDPKSEDPEERKNAIAYPPFMSVNDGYLVVQNSEIICGVMDKATVGDGNKKSVYAVIQRDFGADEAAACMNRMAKLCARWLGAFSSSHSSFFLRELTFLSLLLFVRHTLLRALPPPPPFSLPPRHPQPTRVSRSVSRTSLPVSSSALKRTTSSPSLTAKPTPTSVKPPRASLSVFPVQTPNRRSRVRSREICQRFVIRLERFVWRSLVGTTRL